MSSLIACISGKYLVREKCMCGYRLMKYTEKKATAEMEKETKEEEQSSCSMMETYKRATTLEHVYLT